MSLYVEEIEAALVGLQRFCLRLLQKFDAGAASAELLIDTDELEARITALLPIIPDEVTFGDWKRMTYFMRLFLKKSQPQSCRGDLDYFATERLPGMVKSLHAWGASFAYFDPELRQAIAQLIRTREFNSAIRAAFVVLTERIRTKYKLQPGVDGPALINEVFGKNSVLTPNMEGGERQAIRDYLAGAYGVLRNKYAHGNPSLDLAELEAALATVNLGLKLLS